MSNIEQCPYTDCASNPDCTIMEILGKAPTKDRKCSYYVKKSEKKDKRNESKKKKESNEVPDKTG